MEKLSEFEAIKRTNDTEYIDKTLNTSTWINRKKLNPDGQKALIKRLECFYSSVKVEGKGKKKVYIVDGLRDEPEPIKHNYKPKQLTEYDDVMKEYIHSTLTSHFDKSNTKKELSFTWVGWAELFRLPTHKTLNDKQSQQMIKSYFYQKLDEKLYNPREMASEIHHNINKRSVDVVRNSLQSLNREGKIQLTENYFKVNLNEELVEIEESYYNEISSFISSYLKVEGFKVYDYIKYKNSFKVNEKLSKIIDRIDYELEKMYSAKFIFKSFKVELIESSSKDVEIDKMFEAYYKRLIDLSVSRQNKSNYKDSKIIWRRYYLLNLLIVIEMIVPKSINVKSEIESYLKSNQRAYNEIEFDKFDDLFS